MKDQAKQWLSAGQKWLSGASKKVGQAVKEAQQTINTKLEELDMKPPSTGKSLAIDIAFRPHLETKPTDARAFNGLPRP